MGLIGLAMAAAERVADRAHGLGSHRQQQEALPAQMTMLGHMRQILTSAQSARRETQPSLL